MDGKLFISNDFPYVIQIYSHHFPASHTAIEVSDHVIDSAPCLAQLLRYLSGVHAPLGQQPNKDIASVHRLHVLAIRQYSLNRYLRLLRN